MKHEFSLFKRKHQLIWYFYYYEGTKRISKSTGKTKKSDAEQVAHQFLRLDRKTSDLTLQEYAQNFFCWDSCAWIKRHLSKGRGFSKAIARNYRSFLTRYAFPVFGHIELKNINPVKIENWLVDLPLAGSTKNNVIKMLKIIFNEALKERIIEYNPLTSVERLAFKSQKRTILSIAEIKLLFPEDEQELIRIWDNWFKATLFYTILTTGLRSGEARALRWCDISFEHNTVIIQHAVKADNYIGTTKAGYSRAAFLPNRTVQMLKRLHAELKIENNDCLVFGKADNTHYSNVQVLILFYKGLKNAGIDNSVRNLDVHCMRHTYNTVMRNILSEKMLRFQIGHKNAAMTDHYDQATPLEKLNRLNTMQSFLPKIFLKTAKRNQG